MQLCCKVMGYRVIGCDRYAAAPVAQSFQARPLYEADVFALCLPTVKAVGYTATAPHGAGIVASLINLKSYNLITLYVVI